MRKHIVFLLLFAVLLLPSCDHYQMKKRIAQFEKEMDAYRTQTDNVGLSVVFIRNNKIAYVRHWGLRHIDSEEIMPDGTVKRTGLPMDDKTMLRVASISKTFTATGLLQLVEQGLISLQDDVSDLAGFPIRNPLYPDSVITLEMLMSHTSSLNDDGGYNSYAPGHGYMYCDRNYTIGGQILERISGERFDRYISRHIIEPLGLEGGFNVDSVDHTRLASLYQWNGERYIARDDDAYSQRGELLNDYELGKSAYLFSPASGLKMSALDLAKYVIMHMNYGYVSDSVRILSEAISRDMQQPRSYVGDEHYGLGLLENGTYGDSIVLTGHLGGAYGMRGAIFFNPEEKYGFVMLSNGAHDKENQDENLVHAGTIRRMMKCFISPLSE